MERTEMINKQILQVFELSILAKTQPLDTDTVYAYIAKHKMVDFKDAKTPDRTVAVYMLRLVHNSILVRAVGNNGKWVYTTKEQESLIVGLKKTKRTQGRQKNLLNFIIETIANNDNITIDEICNKILIDRELNNSTVLKNKSIKTTAGKYATLAFNEGKVDRCKVNGIYHYTIKQSSITQPHNTKGKDMKQKKQTGKDLVVELVLNSKDGMTTSELYNEIVINNLMDFSKNKTPFLYVSAMASRAFSDGLLHRNKISNGYNYFEPNTVDTAQPTRSLKAEICNILDDCLEEYLTTADIADMILDGPHVVGSIRTVRQHVSKILNRMFKKNEVTRRVKNGSGINTSPHYLYQRSVEETEYRDIDLESAISLESATYIILSEATHALSTAQIGNALDDYSLATIITGKEDLNKSIASCMIKLLKDETVVRIKTTDSDTVRNSKFISSIFVYALKSKEALLPSKEVILTTAETVMQLLNSGGSYTIAEMEAALPLTKNTIGTTISEIYNCKDNNVYRFRSNKSNSPGCEPFVYTCDETLVPSTTPNSYKESPMDFNTIIVNGNLYTFTRKATLEDLNN